MKAIRLATVAILVVALGACQSLSDNPKRSVGTLLGAGLGALAGSQIGGGTGQLAAVAVGTLAGAYLGGEAGASLDRADRVHQQQTSQRALETSPTGRSTAWRNPDSGHAGTVSPTRTYRTAAGQDCRDYRQTVIIDGRQETAHGTSCRQANGAWRVVN